MDKLELNQDTASKLDLFHRGLITKLFPGNNMGLVRIGSGREVPFSYNLVILSGEVTDPLNLKEGQIVGYDIGWTSSGLRITKIKTYADPSLEKGEPPLEGQGGQGQDPPS